MTRLTIFIIAYLRRHTNEFAFRLNERCGWIDTKGSYIRKSARPIKAVPLITTIEYSRFEDFVLGRGRGTRFCAFICLDVSGNINFVHYRNSY